MANSKPKILNLSLTIILIAFLSATSFSQVLKVGFFLGTPYSFWKVQTFSGIDYDIINKIASLIGYRLDVYILPFSALDLDMLKKLGLDIAAGGIHMTEQRRKTFKFSIPYAQSGLAIVLAKGLKWDGNVEKIRFGVKAGATGERIVKEWASSGKKVQYQVYVSNEEIIANLILKKIDGAFFDYLDAIYLSKLYNFTVHKELIYKINLGYIIINENLENKFNQALKSLMSSYIRQVIVKYIGSENY